MAGGSPLVAAVAVAVVMAVGVARGRTTFISSPAARTPVTTKRVSGITPLSAAPWPCPLCTHLGSGGRAIGGIHLTETRLGR